MMTDDKDPTPEDDSSPQDIGSYRNMFLREGRWAKTGPSWMTLLAVALIVMLCLAWFFGSIVMDQGWESLFERLGWR